MRFLKTLEDRDPLPFKEDSQIKMETVVSKYSCCDAALTAELAKAKIINWIHAARDNIPEPIFDKDVGD